MKRFGVSTHLYHEERLQKTHLLEIAANGFKAVDVFANGRGQRNFSTAVRDSEARSATMHEMSAALNIAKVIPFEFLVVHLGVPAAQHPGPDENNREAAIRSVEEILEMADAVGVKVALEV